MNAARRITTHHITIRMATPDPAKTETREGFLVPDTARTIGVDERGVDNWIITHLPTGQRVQTWGVWRITSYYAAVAIAKAFYREMTALGINMGSADAASLVAQLNELSAADRLAFWTRVQS